MSLVLLLVPFQSIICGACWILLWFCPNLATWRAGPWPSGRFSCASHYQLLFQLALGILTEAWQGTFHLLASTEQKIETSHWSTLVSSIFVNLLCKVTSCPDFLKHLRNPPLHSEVNAFFGERASSITVPDLVLMLLKLLLLLCGE